MCIYRSSDIAQRFKMEAVLHITSKATHVSQKPVPNTQYPSISLTVAKVITRQPTKRSATASEAKNRFPILRNARSVHIATITSTFPATERNIKISSKKPVFRIRIFYKFLKSIITLIIYS